MPLSVFEINHLFPNEWIESSSAVLMPTSVLQKYVCLSSFHYTDMAHKCTTLSPLQNVHKQERLQIFRGGLKTGIPSTIEILYYSAPYQLLLTMRNTPHSIHYSKDSCYCSLALFSGLKLIESANEQFEKPPKNLINSEISK